MNVAAISSVTSVYASLPTPRLQGISAPAAAAAGNVQTSVKNTAATNSITNFGPAVQVQLSPQAQALLASQSTAQSNNTAANNNTDANSQTTNAASLAFTYKTTAEQVWVQVLSAMGLTEQQLNALPLSQRNADEAKAEVQVENLMSAQVQAPQGVSESTEASSISAAVQAVAS